MQSNQFPRAVDLARQFRDAGLQVCIGGFHVSGCLAMLPETARRIDEAQAIGVSMFAGESEEHRLDEVLLDAWNGELKPLYNFMDKLPSLEGEPRADPAAQACRAHVGHLFEHRPRPWLPLSVLVLHHHQRAGAQEPLPHA